MRPLLIFFWPARGCMQKINVIKEKHSCMQIRFLFVAGDTSQYQYPTIRNWHHLFGSTDTCESSFSHMNAIRTRARCSMTYEKLHECLRKSQTRQTRQCNLSHWLTGSKCLICTVVVFWWFKQHCWILNTCPKYVRTKSFIMIRLKVKKEGIFIYF